MVNSYKSLKTLSYLPIGFLAGVIICSFLSFILAFALIAFPDAQLETVDGPPMPVAFALIGLVAIIEFILRIATIIFFLIWEFRAFSNLTPLKADHLEYSPGWAVGWWFIPLANLLKPMQVMAELWNESDPDFDEDLGFLSNSAGIAPIIGFWWAAFLIGNIISWVSNGLIDDAGNIAGAFPYVFMFANIFSVTAAGLAILIVRKITRRQDERAARIGQTQDFQPPPPPTFEPAAE